MPKEIKGIEPKKNEWFDKKKENPFLYDMEGGSLWADKAKMSQITGITEDIFNKGIGGAGNFGKRAGGKRGEGTDQTRAEACNIYMRVPERIAYAVYCAAADIFQVIEDKKDEENTADKGTELNKLELAVRKTFVAAEHISTPVAPSPSRSMTIYSDDSSEERIYKDVDSERAQFRGLNGYHAVIQTLKKLDAYDREQQGNPDKWETQKGFWAKSSATAHYAALHDVYDMAEAVDRCGSSAEVASSAGSSSSSNQPPPPVYHSDVHADLTEEIRESGGNLYLAFQAKRRRVLDKAEAAAENSGNTLRQVGYKASLTQEAPAIYPYEKYFSTAGRANTQVTYAVSPGQEASSGEEKASELKAFYKYSEKLEGKAKEQQKLWLLKFLVEDTEYPADGKQFAKFVKSAGKPEKQPDSPRIGPAMGGHQREEDDHYVDMWIVCILNRDAVMKASAKKDMGEVEDEMTRNQIIHQYIGKWLLGLRGGLPDRETRYQEAARALLEEKGGEIAFNQKLADTSRELVKSLYDTYWSIAECGASRIAERETARPEKTTEDISSEEQFLAAVTQVSTQGKSRISQMKKHRCSRTEHGPHLSEEAGLTELTKDQLGYWEEAVLAFERTEESNEVTQRLTVKNVLELIVGRKLELGELTEKQNKLLLFALGRKELLEKKKGAAIQQAVELLRAKGGAADEPAEEPGPADLKNAVMNLLIGMKGKTLNREISYDSPDFEINMDFLQIAADLIRRPEFLEIDLPLQLKARAQYLNQLETKKTEKSQKGKRLTGTVDQVLQGEQNAPGANKVTHYINHIVQRIGLNDGLGQQEGEVADLGSFQNFVSSLYYLEMVSEDMKKDEKSLDKANVQDAVDSFQGHFFKGFSSLFIRADGENHRKWALLAQALSNRDALDLDLAVSKRMQSKTAKHKDEGAHQQMLEKMRMFLTQERVVEPESEVYKRAARNLVLRQVDSSVQQKYSAKKVLGEDLGYDPSQALATSDAMYIGDWAQVRRAVFAMKESVAEKGYGDVGQHIWGRFNVSEQEAETNDQPPLRAEDYRRRLLEAKDTEFGESGIASMVQQISDPSQTAQIQGFLAEAIGKITTAVEAPNGAEKRRIESFFRKSDFYKIFVLEEEKKCVKALQERNPQQRQLFIHLLQDDSLVDHDDAGPVREGRGKGAARVRRVTKDYVRGRMAAPFTLAERVSPILRSLDAMIYLNEQSDAVAEKIVKETGEEDDNEGNKALLSLRDMIQKEFSKEKLRLYSEIKKLSQEEKEAVFPAAPSDRQEQDQSISAVLEAYRQNAVNFLSNSQVLATNKEYEAVRYNPYWNAALTLFSGKVDSRKLAHLRLAESDHLAHGYEEALTLYRELNIGLFYRALNQTMLAEELKKRENGETLVPEVTYGFTHLEKEPTDQRRPITVEPEYSSALGPQSQSDSPQEVSGMLPIYDSGKPHPDTVEFTKLNSSNLKSLATYIASREEEDEEAANKRACTILGNFLGELLSAEWPVGKLKEASSSEREDVVQYRIIQKGISSLPPDAMPLVFSLLANREAVDLDKGKSRDQEGNLTFRHEMDQEKAGELLSGYMGGDLGLITRELAEDALLNLFTRDMSQELLEEKLRIESVQTVDLPSLTGKNGKKMKSVDWRLLRRVLSLVKNRALYGAAFRKQHDYYHTLLTLGSPDGRHQRETLQSWQQHGESALLANTERRTWHPSDPDYGEFGSGTFQLPGESSSIIDDQRRAQFVRSMVTKGIGDVETKRRETAEASGSTYEPLGLDSPRNMHGQLIAADTVLSSSNGQGSIKELFLTEKSHPQLQRTKLDDLIRNAEEVCQSVNSTIEAFLQEDATTAGWVLTAFSGALTTLKNAVTMLYQATSQTDVITIDETTGQVEVSYESPGGIEYEEADLHGQVFNLAAGVFDQVREWMDIGESWDQYSAGESAAKIAKLSMMSTGTLAENLTGVITAAQRMKYKLDSEKEEAPEKLDQELFHYEMGEEGLTVAGAVSGVIGSVFRLIESVKNFKAIRLTGASPTASSAAGMFAILEDAAEIGGGVAKVVKSSMFTEAYRADSSQWATTASAWGKAVPWFQVAAAGMAFGKSISEAIGSAAERGGDADSMAVINAVQSGISLLGKTGNAVTFQMGAAAGAGYGIPVMAMVGNLFEIAKLSTLIGVTKENKGKAAAVKEAMADKQENADSVMSQLQLDGRVVRADLRNRAVDAMSKRLQGAASIAKSVFTSKEIEQGWQIANQVLGFGINLAASIPGGLTYGAAAVANFATKLFTAGGAAINKKIKMEIQRNATLDEDINLSRQYEMMRHDYAMEELPQFTGKAEKKKTVLISMGLRDERDYYRLMINRAAAELYMQAQYANNRGATVKNALTMGTLRLLGSLGISDIGTIGVNDIVKALAQ